MRKLLVLVLSLISLACEGQMMNNNALLHDSGVELFWIVGDSNGDGRGATIPTVAPNTLFRWQNTAGTFKEITNSTVANFGTTFGSSWQAFATAYKAKTGKKVYIVNSCSGGSEFYPNGDTNNWYTSGGIYDSAKTSLQNAKTALGVSKVKVIVVLGINDIRGSNSVANITTGITSLFSRIDSDFSTPQIYIVQPGRDDLTGYNGQDHQSIRRILLNTTTTANYHIATQMGPFASWGLYNADNLHLNQPGYDLLGQLIARYITLNTVYDKHARSIMASFKDDVSQTKKDAINTFVTSFASFAATVDGFQCYVADTKDNAMVDWGLIVMPQDVNAVAFTANSEITTDGAADYVRTQLLVDGGGTRSNSTDIVEFVKTGTVLTSAGTSAFLFGKSNGGATILSRIYQGASGIHSQVYDGTDNFYGSETKFANNTIYGIARNGTTKMIKKDATDMVSVTQATTGTIATRDSWVGTINNVGSPSTSYLNSGYKCWGVLQLSDFTWSTFVTNLNTLIAAMEVPN